MQYIKKYSLYAIFPMLFLASALLIQPETASSTHHPCAPGEPSDMGSNYCVPLLSECGLGETPANDECVCRDDDALCLGSAGGDGGDDDDGFSGDVGDDDDGFSGDGGKTSGTIKFKNPIASDSIQEFLLKIIDVLLVFAVPIIILMIMYGGFVMVTAQGTPERIKKGAKTLLWAVVGGLIVLGSKIIIDIIEGTIKGF